MATASSPADRNWDDLLQHGTGPVQESFLDLVRKTRHYVGYSPAMV
ncbi:hypothetical protein [Streptomyces rubellomurinus]|nr:hypothetical protein [Streptomyces rubellomurinus]